MKVNNDNNSRKGSVAGGRGRQAASCAARGLYKFMPQHMLLLNFMCTAEQSSAAQRTMPTYHHYPHPFTPFIMPCPSLAPTVGLTWLLVYSLYTSYFLSSFLNCGCLGPASCPASSLCTSPGTTTATTTTRRKKPRKLARRNTHGVVEVLLLRSITMQNF